MKSPRRAFRLPGLSAVMLAAAAPGLAHASLLSGEALDTAANVIAWAALIIVPVVLIGAFLFVHILPEKIAEKRQHPQLAAIKTLCLLSLFFGGLLWPLAWLWAYTKPVLHKLAYGTDIDEHDSGAAVTPLKDARAEPAPPTSGTAAASTTAAIPSASVAPVPSQNAELEDLRRRLRTLEMAMAMAPGPSRPKDPQAPSSSDPT